MFRKITMLLPLVALLAALLAACAKEDTAPDVVARYLNAQVAANAEKLVELACGDFEAQARLDADAFEGVDAKLHDLKCTIDGTEGALTQVTCQGIIEYTYRGEEPSRTPLDNTVYLVKKTGDSWQICDRRDPTGP